MLFIIKSDKVKIYTKNHLGISESVLGTLSKNDIVVIINDVRSVLHYVQIFSKLGIGWIFDFYLEELL